MSDNGKMLKNLYRRAIQICHPDRASADLHSSMEAKAKELTAAYRAKNLSLVRKIAEELGVKDIPPMPNSEPVRPQKYKPNYPQHILDGYLIRGAQNGDLADVKHWIGEGANPNWINPSSNVAYACTALMAAATFGHAEIAEILLATGADPNIAPANGLTALMEATSFGHPEVVKVLLSAGANPDAVSDRGDTALDWAEFKVAHVRSPGEARKMREVIRLLKEANREIRILLEEAKAE